MENIHPITDRLVDRAQQELLLNQKGQVLWMTGLSGSGKSTIAIALQRRLYEMGYLVKVLDGDNIRTGVNSNLGFSLEDRRENIRRIAEVAKLFLETGVIVICSFVSPTIAIRNVAKSIIGDTHFKEVYVSTSLAVCEDRDVKGLYEKARAGELQEFTGIDSPYEPPIDADLVLNTEELTVEESVEICLKMIENN